MTKLSVLFFAIIIILMMSCSVKKEENNQQPNVLLILADDLGWNQTSSYGGPYITPNIDKLAKEGLRFTQAYASAAICSPTRAALMTGKYPARLHLTDFIKGEIFPDSFLRQPEWQQFLPLEEKTIGEVFQKNGYKTALFGKWHLSRDKRPPASMKYNPDKQGFDESMVTYKPVKNETDPEYDPHNVDAITTRSIQFLKENNSNPFLLVVSHNAIHDPVMESKARIKAFGNIDTSGNYKIRPELAAMVNRLDEGTGRLLEELEKQGLTDNTIVIFYSDNGGKQAHADQRPLRKGKGWLYEGGVRVPLIIKWPGITKRETTTDFMCSTIDLFPTLCDMVGIDASAEQIDGKSFVSMLQGEKMVPQPQYWHYPHYHRGSGMKPASAIRKGDYKLIEWHEELLSGEKAHELYDLSNDIGEQNNLAEKLPKKLEALKSDLSAWRNKVQAQMPELKN